MSEKITSKANPRVKELCSLRDHPSPSRFLIEGKHMVDMAFLAGRLELVIASAKADYPGIPVLEVSEEVLGKIAPSKTPAGLLGVANASNLGRSGDYLLLDRIQDPGNVGTLLRSAASFGFRRVAVLPGTASPFSSKALASSQGAVFALDLILVKDGSSFVEGLKAKGVAVLGTSLREATPISSYLRPRGDIALILGNEGQGMSEELLSVTDENLYIEMEEMESLNVGVAGGIAMYLLKR